MHPLLHSARRLAACLTLLTGSFSLLPAQNFVTHDANNTEATFDFSQFDPAVNAPGLRTYLGLRIKVGYYVFAGDQSINVETTPDNGADKPYREVAFHENVSRGTKDVVGLGPDGPLALYENATTWKFTGTSPILVGGSFELGLARPEIVFDHFIIQPHSTYSMFFSFLTIGTSDLKLKLVGHNLLQNNDISFQNDFSTTSIGIENCSKWKTIDPPTSLTLSLSGDSLTIFYPPNTIPGETLIPNRFEGSDDGEYSLIIDNKYLDVQGGLINWKTITLNDGVVTATKRSAYNLGSLMPEGTSGVCSRWYEGGNLIINGGSLKADVFKKTACPDFCDRLMENIQPVNSDNQPVFRVLVPHHGLFNFSVTGTGGTSFNQTYSFSAHHPDDDPNYYIYLPSGSYSISFEGHEPQSVTVNNAHQPIEGGDETVTPPSDEANYVHSYPPSEETISINIRQEKALRVSVKEEQCDLGITPTSTKPIPLPEPRDDYQILFSDHLNPQLTGPGSTTFTIGNNIHHMVFNNTYFEYFNINRFNTLDALRHLDFQGDNTVWRQPGNPGEEGGIQFALNFAAVSKTAGIVISGDSLTVGGLYQPYGALTSGSRGAFHLELDIDYLTLWGGLGGVSVVNLYNGIDSVFVKKGVVTSLGEEAGMYCTNKVFIEPSASLKSQSFDSTACGSLSFFGDGRSGYIDVRPTNLAGKPVYCVAIPNEGGKSVYMQDLNSSFRLQVYFTSHHPLYDHQTGQPIPGTADPYYYIFLPNSEYRFSIQNLHKFEASVEGEDVIATPFSLNFDDYSMVEFQNNSSTAPNFSMDIKLTLTSGTEETRTELIPPTFTGGKPDDDGNGITYVYLNSKKSTAANSWTWDEDLAFLNTYFDRLVFNVGTGDYFSASGKRAIHFYGQNTIRPKIQDEEFSYFDIVEKERTVNSGISLSVGTGSTAALDGDSLTVYAQLSPKNSTFIPDFTYINRGAIRNLQVNTTSALEFNMDYLYLRGPFAAVSGRNNDSKSETAWGEIRANKGVITCLGEHLSLLEVSKVIVSENASLKLTSVDGSRTGSNSVHSKLASFSYTAGTLTLSDDNLVQPVNPAGDPVYCVSVPHHGALAFTLRDAASSRPLAFTAHHPLHDADGLPSGDTDPNYYLWLPAGDYEFLIPLQDGSTQVYTATVEEADLEAVAGELIPPPVPPAPPTPPAPGPGQGGDGGEDPVGAVSTFRVSFSSNGVLISQLAIKQGDFISLDDVPAGLQAPEDGQSLLFWYRASDPETPWDFAADSVMSNFTLIAHWGVPGPPDALAAMPDEDIRFSRIGDLLSVASHSGAPILALQVTDLTGRTLLSLRNADTPLTFSLSAFPQGAYLLRIITAHQSRQFKFIR